MKETKDTNYSPVFFPEIFFREIHTFRSFDLFFCFLQIQLLKGSQINITGSSNANAAIEKKIYIFLIFKRGIVKKKYQGVV